MKVLLLLGNYPQLSETYITTEIDFLMRSGISVEVWSPSITTPGVPEQTKVHRGSLKDAVASFGPDITHVHFLFHAGEHSKTLGDMKIPMTVRGHSFDFDRTRAGQVAQIERVKKIYLFPHFARMCSSPKIVPLPVAYNSTRYVPYEKKNRKAVLRTSAGKRNKGLGDFFATAALCPEFSFTLASADVCEDKNYFEELGPLNSRVASGRVSLIRNASWSEAAKLTLEAGIYLDTSDPTGHPFGMPISIAESLVTGSFVLALDGPAAREYLGNAGRVYRSPSEAAFFINETLKWDEEKWVDIRKAAIERARSFSDEIVLSRIIADWCSLLGQPTI